MEDALQMIEDCEKRESKLSAWEKNFIASVAEQVERGLSTMQLQTLEKIWDRVTS